MQSEVRLVARVHQVQVKRAELCIGGCSQLKHGHRCDQSDHPCRWLEVADTCLDAAESACRVLGGQPLREGSNLRWVAERRACAVCFDAELLPRCSTRAYRGFPGPSSCEMQQQGLGRAVRCCQTSTRTILPHGTSRKADHLPCTGRWVAGNDEAPDTLTAHVAVGARVEGLASTIG